MERFLQVLEFALDLLIALSIASCGVSPMGRRQLLLLPDSRVDQQGAQLYLQYKQEVPRSTSAMHQKYVACVAGAIVREAREGNVPQSWEVNVFEDDSPNAFAVPGGKIGVNSGLLDVAKNQDQLAAVLGHEVSHVLARHSNERASADAATNLALQGVAASGVVGDPATSQSARALFGAFGLGARYGLILPYGRSHESEADLMGLDLMAQASFDPRQAVEFWRNMDAAAAKSGGDAPPEFLSTHPGSTTRKNDLSARLPHAMQLFEAARAQGKKPNCG